MAKSNLKSLKMRWHTNSMEESILVMICVTANSGSHELWKGEMLINFRSHMLPF